MLRTRSFLIFLGFTVLLAVSAVLAARYTLVAELDRLERQFAEDALRAIRATVNGELTKLTRTTQDWAFWDATYQFIADLNEAYIQENLTEDALTTLHLRGALYYDEGRNLRYQAAFDSESGHMGATFPEAFLSAVDSAAALFPAAESSECTSGILTHDGQALLAAACPILGSHGEGPARGTLVFLREFDKEILTLIKETANRPITVSVLPFHDIPPEWLSAPGFFLEIMPAHIVGGVLFRDLPARSGLLLQIKQERSIHAQAVRSLTVFAVTLIALILWTLGALWYLVDRKVLQRISTLVRKTRNLPIGMEHSAHPTSFDEISVLRRSMDGLLEALEKALEENLKKQAEIQSILDAQPVGIFLIDAETRTVTWANTNALALINRSMEELQRLPCKDVLCSSRGPDCPFLDQGLEIRDMECSIPPRDGEPIPVLRSMVSVTYDRRPHVLTAVMDLRTQKALEDQLDRAKKLETVGLVAGGVAHDLNNLLTSIMGYPDLLLRRVEENHPFYRPLTLMRDAGLKAGAIVQDLLVLARRGVKSMERTDVNDAVGRYFASTEFSLLRSSHPHVQFRLQIGTPDAFILGSEAHLEKALGNLIRNAAEAIEGVGSVTVTVQRVHLNTPRSGYETVPAGRWICVRVEDTGSGIAEKDLPHIFEPFYTKKKMGRSGTGLGMTIIWHAVRDMDGYVDVESDPGRGTVFSLFLPEAAPPAEEKTDALPKTFPRGSGEKILVVEDMEDQRNLVKTLLTDLGYHVLTARNGREALELAATQDFDALVLDMMLEDDMDGATVYREILKIHPDQKALVVSGDVASDRVAEVTALGVCRFVSKPYSLEKLASAVHAVLDGKPGAPTA